MKRVFLFLTLVIGWGAQAQITNSNTIPFNTWAGTNIGFSTMLQGLNLFIGTNQFAINTQPYILVIGDSRCSSLDAGWLNHVKTNANWQSRAGWINTAVPGKGLQGYVDNFDTEILPYISANSNQTWVSAWIGVNDTNSLSVTETNFITLWTKLRTNGCKIIQFAGGLGVTNALEDFIRTNSSYYDAFVNVTNFSSDDDLHPNLAGGFEIANLFLGATTNLIPVIKKSPAAFFGETVFSPVNQTQVRSATTIRSLGKIILDTTTNTPHNLSEWPGIWVNYNGTTENHMGISWDANNTNEDLQFFTFSTNRMNLMQNGNLALRQSDLWILAAGTERTTDKTVLKLRPLTGFFRITSTAEGSTVNRNDLKLDADRDYIYLKGYPNSGIGINTTNPTSGYLLDVNGSLIVQTNLNVKGTNSTGYLVVTNNVSVGSLTVAGTNYFSIPDFAFLTYDGNIDSPATNGVNQYFTLTNDPIILGNGSGSKTFILKPNGTNRTVYIPTNFFRWATNGLTLSTTNWAFTIPSNSWARYSEVSPSSTNSTREWGIILSPAQ